jgi:ubiquinone/menaquinone biosynthesis C-methylase UbiE
VPNEDKAWLDYQEKFSEVYDETNYANSIQSWAMRAGHKLLEKDYGDKYYFERVLEVGAGTGQHAQFVRHNFSEYKLTDLDSKILEIAREKLTFGHICRLRFEVQNASQLSYPDNTFDRLIATHVLEHIHQPHLALKEWRRVLKNGGVISILIPTDSGISWRLGRHLGPRKNAIKFGIAYDYAMAREHVNSCYNLIALLRHYFKGSKESFWPLSIPSVDLNLFFSFNATIIKDEDC